MNPLLKKKKKIIIIVKNIILILMLALMAMSCSEEYKETLYTQGLSVIEYDGCEYIVGYQTLAHKGNCTFCAARKCEK